MGFVDWYLAVSPELQHWAVEKLELPLAHTTVLGNALLPGRFNEAIVPAKLDAVSQSLKAVMIANLRPQKDHGFLLQALAISSLARVRLHVYLVGLDAGDVYSRKIHGLVSELSLESNISFLGSRTDIPNILKSVDFGLLSSQSESGPVVLLEYMAAGLPFVATNTGQIAALLAGAGLPYFVEPGNIAAYAACLDELILLTDEQKLATASRENQLLHIFFDIQQRVDVLIDVYQNLGLNDQVEAKNQGLV
jgi:glycosyltransferase involved in cell wall biosynthesis